MERIDADFKRAVLMECFSSLEGKGFTRYRKEDVDWPFDDKFHGWLGLNVGLYPDRLEVNPFVGIHVVPIMRMYTKLEGRKYNRGHATYAIHMGEIAPEEPAFHFTRATDFDVEAARLAGLCSTVGVDYAKSIASYERLLPLLESRIDMLGGYPERFACCLYLMGRQNEAQSFTDDFVAKYRDYFASFAVPFLRMLRERNANR